MSGDSAPDPLSGKRILVTGVTSMVAGPMAAALAADNVVYGAARFRDAAAREPHEAAGITTVRADLATGDFDELPDVSQVDYVLNFAVGRSNDWDADFAANVEGAAQLMARYQGVGAFFQCSTAGVYESQGHTLLAEDAPLGDSHRAAGMDTYSISKIAAEALVQHTARRLHLPTVIARLSVPYGDTFGWPMFQLMMIEHGMAMPVSEDPPTTYSPLHLDDIVASLPHLLAAASVPATVVNWGGDDVVSVEEWCTHIAELIGADVRFEPSANAIPSIPLDVSRLHALGFRSSVPWRDGIRRMVETLRPELVAR
jgi:nucleoside-diphosphate-sugar epimerase